MTKPLHIFIVCAVILFAALVLGCAVLVFSGQEDDFSQQELTDAAEMSECAQQTMPSDGASGDGTGPEPERSETEPPETPAPIRQPIVDRSERLYDWVQGEFPDFYQNDYPDDMYGSGTIQNNGCSITCLAMLASAMTGHTYSPDELAYYFGGWAENNIQRLEMGSEALQLPFRKAKNADQVWPALEDGKYVVALMNKKSLFTSSQHFILLTGYNEEGRILVKDPNRNNYSHWLTAEGLKIGFTKGQILQGYSGAWIYDPDAMPEKPFIYSQERLDMTRENYPGLTLTDEERKMIASLIWVEARGECAEGQQAVAEVIFNRMTSERFPNTVRGIVYGEGQFPTVAQGQLEKAEPWQAQYQAIDRALHGDPVLDKEVFFYARTALTPNVFGIIGNHVFCY